MNNSTALCAAFLPCSEPAAIEIPANACDTHAHVFGPESKYPYIADRTYTPPDASLAEYQQMLATLGLERAVIVQPSVYGTDNRATLDAVEQGGKNYRAVVVVNEDISESELERMHAQGARGVRVNLLFRSNFSVSSLKKLTEKIANFGWHLQLLIDVSQFEHLHSTLSQLPVDLVFDHMGHMPTQKSLSHQGFQQMLGLVESGKGWVKLSGSYRFTSQQQAPYTDVQAVAKNIIKANPERVVWASDWPHPHIPVEMPSDTALLNMLGDWAEDAASRQKILVDNPATLYGFKD